MNPSLFIEFIQSYFAKVVGKITEKFNDKKAEPTLLHKSMLVEEYSADLHWGATTINHSIVAADVVALDSSLPLKKRATIKTASGELPKLGIKYKKSEKQITDIQVMVAKGVDEQTIVAKVFDDVPRAIKGIDVRNEIEFQRALSTGFCLVEDETNVGTGIRVDYGYKAENQFHALVAAWGETGATPQDDVQQLFDKAQLDGNAIQHVYMSKKFFNLFRNSEQGKRLAANYLGMVIINGSDLPVPSRKNFLDAIADEFGAVFHVVNSSFRIEKEDGTSQAINPWEQGNIVAVPSETVGRLVYGTLVEETNPVAGVDYSKSGNYTLVSKYSKNDPFAEFTSAQATCLPVIDNADSIYVLHAGSTGAFTVDTESLSFPKSASTKTANVHYDGDGTLTVTSTESWATVSMADNGVLTISCAANSSTARTANVTISDGTTTKTIAVSQAAA